MPKQAQDFTYNEKFKHLIEQAGLTYDEVVSLLIPFHPNIKRGYISKWINNDTRLRKDVFDAFLEELPDFIDDKITYYHQRIKTLEHCNKHIVSVIHNELHLHT